MKVLDLGAHDGFVTTWLARQAREVGMQVHVDGIELNPDAVKVANRRLDDHGIDGIYRIGMAEDAHKMFEPGDYDAVVAYELIEHVPDMDEFLTGVEKMCRPGGRVYISTPDGTFGTGQNPHHLRAITSKELFDLLRRRGEMHGMISGMDGVSVAAYEPSFGAKRPTATIYCGPGWQRWSPHDIETKGLGGSETAAVKLAEALDEQGYSVTVYADTDEMAFGQVAFRRHDTFDQLEPVDLLVVSRAPHIFDRPHKAKRACLWMHDTDYGPGALEVGSERVSRIDAIMVLSKWHRLHVMDMYGLGGSKVLVTGNGIEPSYFTKGFQGIGFDRNTHRAIFSSSPDRGLDFLLRVWPMVRDRVEDAELFYCYSDVYSAVAKTNPKLREFHERCLMLSSQPGVVNLGSLPQPGLAAAMRECGVWCAPSYNSMLGVQFNETFCIGAVEAAAAGCRRIISAWGALPERMSSLDDAPSTISLMADDAPDEQEWVDAIVEQMTAEPFDHAPSQDALATTWSRVASDFTGEWAEVYA